MHLILLDFITRTILGEEYKSFSSSIIKHKNCGKLIYIVEGKIHNKDMRKKTQYDAAHLKIDDS